MNSAYTLLTGPTGAIEARATQADGPGDADQSRGRLAYAIHWLGLESGLGMTIDHETALAYSAVWGCVRAICHGLCSVGWHAYETQADGRTRLPIEDNEAWLLDFQANPEMTAFSFREKMLKDATTWGNAWAEIERNGSGKAKWLWPLGPSRCELLRDDEEGGDGALWLKIDNGPHRDPSWLPYRDVFHVKGLGPDGLVGYSVIELARRAIRLGLQEERFGTSVFGKGPMPGGFLKVPQRLSDAQHRELRRSFETAYSGEENAGRVVILHGGAEFTAGQLPNDDQQFLESRRFQVNEICRWFGVPPHKLADLERATFSNVEEQERAFVTDCLLPWARRLETEADVKLYGPVNRGRKYTRLNLDALMRGNSATQTQTVTSKVASGLVTINEGRGMFDLNPIDGGDTALIQGAMVRLEDVVNPPEPEEPPAPPEEPDEMEPDEMEEEGMEKGKMPAGSPAARIADAVRVFGGLLTDAYDRLLRVEIDKGTRALKQGGLRAHAEDYYGGASEAAVLAQLLPAFEGFLLACGGSPARARELAAAAARAHNDRSRAELLADGARALAAWQGGTRAIEQAALALAGVARAVP